MPVVEIFTPYEQSLMTIYGKAYTKRLRKFATTVDVDYFELIDIHCAFIQVGHMDVMPILKAVKEDADKCNLPFSKALLAYINLVDSEIINPEEFKSQGKATSNDNTISPRELNTSPPAVAKLGDCGIQTDARIGRRGKKRIRKTETNGDKEVKPDNELKTPIAE